MFVFENYGFVASLFSASFFQALKMGLFAPSAV
jgi:hypothetical protein